MGKELRLTVILESEEKPIYKLSGYRLWTKNIGLTVKLEMRIKCNTEWRKCGKGPSQLTRMRQLCLSLWKHAEPSFELMGDWHLVWLASDVTLFSCNILVNYFVRNMILLHKFEEKSILLVFRELQLSVCFNTERNIIKLMVTLKK